MIFPLFDIVSPFLYVFLVYWFCVLSCLILYLWPIKVIREIFMVEAALLQNTDCVYLSLRVTSWSLLIYF